MAGPVSSSAHRPLVLVVTNDSDPAAAQTSRLLALALGKIGYQAVVRDTRLNRWGAHEAREASPERREAFETAVVAKWTKLVNDYGVDLVLGIDANWLLAKDLFLQPDSRVQKIHSLWLGDVKLVVDAFPLDARATLNAPKVAHHCRSDAQVEALRALGLERVHLLTTTEPWEQILAEIFL